MELELELETDINLLTKKGELFEDASGQLIFICCLCGSANVGLSEVETHLKTHIALVVYEDEVEKENKTYLNQDHNYHTTKDKEEFWIKSETSTEYDDQHEESDNVKLSISSQSTKLFNKQPESTIKNPLKSTVQISRVAYWTSSKQFFPKFDKFKCDICNKVFAQKGLVKAHLDRHVGTKPHGCEICGHQFSNSGNLKHHIERHSKTKNYHCNECGKSFIILPELKKHVKRHRGDRDFMCTTCGKQYSTKFVLTAHIRNVHGNERKFKCRFTGCQQSYFLSYNLKIHERRHTGERPLSCNVCNQTFANPKVLRTHKQIHFEEKKFECQYCPSKFAQSSGRRGHERRAHEVLY